MRVRIAAGVGAATFLIACGHSDASDPNVTTSLVSSGIVAASEASDPPQVARPVDPIPPEFRPACGKPGAHVSVRGGTGGVVKHTACDLGGVVLEANGSTVTVPAPGAGVESSVGLRVTVDAATSDVTYSASAEDNSVEVIFRVEGSDAARDAVAARCGFTPHESAFDQPRGRFYDGPRPITEKALRCLSDQPEVERVALRA